MPDQLKHPLMPKVAIVTGAGKRVGRAIALGLAEAGYAVAIHVNRSVEEGEAVAREITTAGGQAIVVRADLTDIDDVRGIIPAAAEALGPIGLLVNNASLFQPDSATDLDPDLWDRHFAVHAKSPAFLAQDFASQLPDDQHGVIINIVDQRVWRLNPQFLSYTASKATLWTLTRTLAQALAPRIRVNAIGPGPTMQSVHQSGGTFDDEASSVPLGHGPQLAEFVSAIRFIIETPSMTGQMIAIDGGQHLAWQTPDIAHSGS